MNNRYDVYDLDRDNYTFTDYIQRVFVYMSLGLFVTSATSYLCYTNIAGRGFLYHLLVSFPYAFIIIVLAEMFISITIGHSLYRMSAAKLKMLFFLYAVLNGISFSTIFIVYQISDIFLAFIFATGFFVSMALIGKTTKLDLTKYRTIFIAGMISLLVMSILSIFLRYSKMDILTSWIGLLLFMGLTIYDIQKVRNVYYHSVGDLETTEKLGILGAFELYLDFINMFIYILRIQNSKRRRN